MKRTGLFIKTSKTVPADEVARNAQLLTQAGFVHKEMAGAYDFLPLGLRVLENIKQIVREEMNAIGGQELSLTALQNPELWQKTGRWDDKATDIWFKTKLKNGTELGLAPTHEEAITNIMKRFISSYKDLPAYPYQFQTKFRNELRSRSGLMRGREFLMKDLYSFSLDEKQHEVFYEKSIGAYFKVFERLGFGGITYKTFASGGMFSKYSHEFQTLSPVGEDTIFVDKQQNIAVNKEVMTDEVLKDLGVKRAELVEETAVEVGNIFTLGYKFSEALDLKYTDSDGKEQLVYMGCYGIGPSRVMGLIAEHFADERGLVWPANVAPFQVYLINIGDDENVVKITTKLYNDLRTKGIEVLWDDRDARPGEKFADADLFGIPHRVVVSPKTVEQNSVEYKARTSDKTMFLTTAELLKKMGCN
jgi:prolyl-tRNA synthetase